MRGFLLCRAGGRPVLLHVRHRDYHPHVRAEAAIV